MKKRIKNVQVYWHDNHIDLDIDLESIPFDVSLDEDLICKVKGTQKLGIRTDNKVHIFIAKRVKKWIA